MRLLQAKETGAIATFLQVASDPTDPNAVYRFVVEMCALIEQVPGQENMTPHEYVTSGAAAATLYPFVRETVANLTWKGRFGPIWLNPFNFQAAFASASVSDPLKSTQAPTKTRRKRRARDDN
jgi:hypothetical protein